MRFIRVVSMMFDPGPKEWTSWRCHVGEVTVQTLGRAPSPEERLRLIVTAEMPTPHPQRDEDNFLVIPDALRTTCESALETVVNTISVFGRCRRSISSASPSAALSVEDPTERILLDRTRGFRAKRPLLASHHYEIALTDALIAGLSDRVAGVALLAEVFGHAGGAARFRELVRFFEAAFALPFDQTAKKLVQCLNPTHGYTRAEINTWVAMRDPMIHADRMKSDRLLLGADAMRVVDRMEQAALDVLFNKEHWHDRSKSRRSLWTPIAATTSSSGGLLIQERSTPKLDFQLFDEFDVFPLDLEAVISSPPASWWFKFEERAPDQRSKSRWADKGGVTLGGA